MELPKVKRVKSLEEENTRLKKLHGRSHTGQRSIIGHSGPKVLTTNSEAGSHDSTVMCEATGLSQRHVCRLTGLSLSTCRYEMHQSGRWYLSARITELALERRRFGYRRIWQPLRREGLCVNHKRVYRIYHLNGLGVKHRRHRKGLAT